MELVSDSHCAAWTHAVRAHDYSKCTSSGSGRAPTAQLLDTSTLQGLQGLRGQDDAVAARAGAATWATAALSRISCTLCRKYNLVFDPSQTTNQLLQM